MHGIPYVTYQISLQHVWNNYGNTGNKKAPEKAQIKWKFRNAEWLWQRKQRGITAKI